jgi:hypothetical protein
MHNCAAHGRGIRSVGRWVLRAEQLPDLGDQAQQLGLAGVILHRRTTSLSSIIAASDQPIGGSAFAGEAAGQLQHGAPHARRTDLGERFQQRRRLRLGQQVPPAGLALRARVELLDLGH